MRLVLTILAALFAFSSALAAVLVLSARPARGDPQRSLSWIPPACCATNDCCWEIAERELDPLPGNQWRVRATGQVMHRTGWSPDGRFYRCACDRDVETGNWIRHQGAHTRCLFVPMRAVML